MYVVVDPLIHLPSYLLLVGAGIMFVSSGITAYANILMKLDAVAISRDVSRSPKFILSRRLVITAVCLYVIGGCADVVALAFVPLSLRACASVLTIPMNALFAKLLLGESMLPVQVLGAGITVSSAIGAMLFAAQQSGDSSADDIIDLLLSRRMLGLILWTLPGFCLCLLNMYRHMPGRGEILRLRSLRARFELLICTAFAVSYQTGWTNLLIKSIAVLMKQERVLTVPFLIISLLIIASALAQMVLMSAMMRLFEAVVIIPPYQIMITAWLVVFSAVIFHEWPQNTLGFTAALLVSFGGIFLVALPNGRATTTPPPPDILQELTDAQPLVPI